MDYPIWELEIGGGLLIAAVAIVHVFVSHFAIGGGLFLVVSEHLAYRHSDHALLAWLKRHSTFFALLTLVFGAITGVGIWFTIGLVHPTATSALIHLFVWVWAIEWTFFILEVAAAIIYAKTWDLLDRRTHLIVGWIYFVASFFSLVTINGILSFMYTPGAWLETGELGDAFFNPTFWPSLLVRTLAAAAFAGLYVFVTAWREAPATRGRLARYGALWALPGTVAGPAAAYLYFRVAGDTVWEAVRGAVPKAVAGFHAVIGGAAAYTVLLVIVLLLARRKPTIVSLPVGILLLAFGMMSIGGGEFIRENARKPWVIGNADTGGYMYANGVRAGVLHELRGAGLLAESRWLLPPGVGESQRHAEGRNLFRVACRSCHTLDGYNAIRPLVAGKPEPILSGVIATLENRRGRMPPFPGSAAERAALAQFLAGLAGAPDVVAAKPDGARLLEDHCLSCHALEEDGGLPGLLPLIDGWDAEEAFENLGQLSELNDEMPDFEGSDEERRTLAEHLAELAGGGR
jgi:mono/diheme cytochrome c family protein